MQKRSAVLAASVLVLAAAVVQAKEITLYRVTFPEQKKIDLLGTLSGHVDALRDKARDMSTMAGFLHFRVQPSEEGYASFSVSSGASAGAHTLRVTATGDKHPDSEGTLIGLGRIASYRGHIGGADEGEISGDRKTALTPPCSQASGRKPWPPGF